MAQLTLLEVVQSYLNATDGWNVSSISDTSESEQVALIAKEVFFEVVNDIKDWKYNQKLIKLDSLADLTKPNYLSIPSSFQKIKFSEVRYNKRTELTGNNSIRYGLVDYLSPQDWLDCMNQRAVGLNDSQLVQDFSGVSFVIKNKAPPTFCTSIDDKYLIFDSFNSDVEDTLQSSQSQIIATVEKTFTIEDQHLIDLPDDFMPDYLSLVKARASEYLRQEPLFTDARRGRMGLIRARQNQQKIGSPYRRPIFKRYSR